MAQTPPPGVTVSQALQPEIVNYDPYDGRIQAGQTADVRPRVRGHLVKIDFEDGEIVKKNAVLFEIDPRQYKAALDAANALQSAADAGFQLAKKEYNRTSRLAPVGAASAEDVDVAMAKVEVCKADQLKAKAAVEQATLDLGFTKVGAPIAGRTSRALVDVGNLVNAGGGETLLTTITSVDPMYVYFDVDEPSMKRYREEYRKKDGSEPSLKDLKIPVEVALEGDKGYPYHGFINFAENKVNANTGTIQVRGELPNPTRMLTAGMRALVRVPIGERHKVLMVTERAVGNDQGQKFLYVVNDQGVVERRDVELGRVRDGMQIITSGLNADDWVIVNGIQRVRDAMKVEAKRGPMPGAEAFAAESATKKSEKGK